MIRPSSVLATASHVEFRGTRLEHRLEHRHYVIVPHVPNTLLVSFLSEESSETTSLSEPTDTLKVSPCGRGRISRYLDYGFYKPSSSVPLFAGIGKRNFLALDRVPNETQFGFLSPRQRRRRSTNQLPVRMIRKPFNSLTVHGNLPRSGSRTGQHLQLSDILITHDGHVSPILPDRCLTWISDGLQDVGHDGETQPAPVASAVANVDVARLHTPRSRYSRAKRGRNKLVTSTATEMRGS